MYPTRITSELIAHRSVRAEGWILDLLLSQENQGFSLTFILRKRYFKWVPLFSKEIWQEKFSLFQESNGHSIESIIGNFGHELLKQIGPHLYATTHVLDEKLQGEVRLLVRIALKRR